MWQDSQAMDRRRRRHISIGTRRQDHHHHHLPVFNGCSYYSLLLHNNQPTNSLILKQHGLRHGDTAPPQRTLAITTRSTVGRHGGGPVGRRHFDVALRLSGTSPDTVRGWCVRGQTQVSTSLSHGTARRVHVDTDGAVSMQYAVVFEYE